MIGLPKRAARVVPHDPEWRQEFVAEAERLREALGQADPEVLHIGSTAMPGMAAKPVIDLMVAVESLEKGRSLVPLLEAMGYTYLPDEPVPGRVYLEKGPITNRTHNLSLSVPGSDFWEEKLVFIHYMETHPEAAEAYVKLKRELAAKYPEDRPSYTAGKHDFIQNILRLAGFK